MLFHSMQFVIFFPIVVSIYFLIPYRFRWILLLLSSYYFYMCWKPEYILLILASTTISYYTGIKMGQTDDRKTRKKYLLASLLSNLSILFLFKYFTFFNESLRSSLQHFNLTYGIPNLSLLLPVGISFYTFQTLSYSMDVYRGKIKPENHFGIFALFVSFFPQLVAGPIERSSNLLPQFYKDQHFDYKRVTTGLKIMAWGFFKKVVIADRLAVLVDTVYNHPTSYQGLPLILATVFFAFQIYCDFSGYSSIAIGAAKIMGYHLMENFKRPYFSKSITEFWRRWHISLSSWFKDYLYVPMGGNRVGIPRGYLNMFVVFVVSGLWHGANWTFILWGALHGMYIILEKLLCKAREKFVGFLKKPFLQKCLQVGVTFCLVDFAWIFFRANSLSDGTYIATHLFSGLLESFNLSALKDMLSGLGLPKLDFIIAILGVAVLELVHLVQRHENRISRIFEKYSLVRWASYYVMVMMILFFTFTDSKEFVYFQF